MHTCINLDRHRLNRTHFETKFYTALRATMCTLSGSLFLSLSLSVPPSFVHTHTHTHTKTHARTHTQCIHVYIYVYTYIRLRIHTYSSVEQCCTPPSAPSYLHLTHTYIHTHMYMHTRTYIHVCIHLRIHTQQCEIKLYTAISPSSHTHIHTHIHTFTHIYIHTYTTVRNQIVHCHPRHLTFTSHLLSLIFSHSLFLGRCHSLAHPLLRRVTPTLATRHWYSCRAAWVGVYVCVCV